MTDMYFTLKYKQRRVKTFLENVKHYQKFTLDKSTILFVTEEL